MRLDETRSRKPESTQLLPSHRRDLSQTNPSINQLMQQTQEEFEEGGENQPHMVLTNKALPETKTSLASEGGSARIPTERQSTYNEIRVQTHVIENGKKGKNGPKILMKRQSQVPNNSNREHSQGFNEDISEVQDHPSGKGAFQRTGGKHSKRPVDFQARIKRGSIYRKNIKEKLTAQAGALNSFQKGTEHHHQLQQVSAYSSNFNNNNNAHHQSLTQFKLLEPAGNKHPQYKSTTTSNRMSHVGGIKRDSSSPKARLSQQILTLPNEVKQKQQRYPTFHKKYRLFNNGGGRKSKNSMLLKEQDLFPEALSTSSVGVKPTLEYGESRGGGTFAKNQDLSQYTDLQQYDNNDEVVLSSQKFQPVRKGRAGHSQQVHKRHTIIKTSIAAEVPKQDSNRASTNRLRGSPPLTNNDLNNQGGGQDVVDQRVRANSQDDSFQGSCTGGNGPVQNDSLPLELIKGLAPRFKKPLNQGFQLRTCTASKELLDRSQFRAIAGYSKYTPRNNTSTQLPGLQSHNTSRDCLPLNSGTSNNNDNNNQGGSKTINHSKTRASAILQRKKAPIQARLARLNLLETNDRQSATIYPFHLQQNLLHNQELQPSRQDGKSSLRVSKSRDVAAIYRNQVDLQATKESGYNNKTRQHGDSLASSLNKERAPPHSYRLEVKAAQNGGGGGAGASQDFDQLASPKQSNTARSHFQSTITMKQDWQ